MQRRHLHVSFERFVTATVFVCHVNLRLLPFRHAEDRGREGGREGGRKAVARARLGLRHVPRDERYARGSIFLTAGHGHRHKAQQNTDDNDAETEKEEQRERRTGRTARTRKSSRPSSSAQSNLFT